MTDAVIGLPTNSVSIRLLPAQPAQGALQSIPSGWVLPGIASILTLGPVFLQAPLVRLAPMVAIYATAPLVLVALACVRHPNPGRQRLGLLLVGFAGSWLGGTLFWGWCREHPLWHLPIEAFALPLAIGGLGTRWRIGAWFYLASLLGTALTDGLIALTGLMPLWPPVVQASPAAAAALLREAAQSLFQPSSLLPLALAGAWILHLARQLQRGDEARRVAAATLACTLLVDGVFLGVALLAPQLSGLI
ncbi:MAG: DUF3120 domain-containing protein [Cyanobacteriota bacterium]|nr:DUF3120 domain-containing protein [Cyanobacteriota bacterium]